MDVESVMQIISDFIFPQVEETEMNNLPVYEEDQDYLENSDWLKPYN